METMSDTVTVDVTEGCLRGRKTTTKTGNTCYTFQGVPYAKPPVGPLRFKVAQPLEPWSGVRDALKEGTECTQFDFQFMKMTGTEDCLHLNICSPQLPASEAENPRLPVMVWIHGGGYVCGSGTAQLYGTDYFVDQGVLTVSIYYRLGIFGFLCLNDPVAPGNIGLKDQVAALRWVQKNISRFGGDPNNVTIFGESAGGASVHMHMLSPMSKGLFVRAIAQSGAAFNPWGFDHHPREAAFRVGAVLGYEGDQPEELVEFLRGIDHMTLMKAVHEHGLSEQDKQRILAFAFVPTLEVEAEGVERFLPASPMEVLEDGRYQDVPYMTGVTDKEGIFAMKFADCKEPESLAKIDKEFDTFVQLNTRLPAGYCKTKVGSKLRNYFLNGQPLTEDTLPGFFDLCSDLWFAEGVHVTVKKMAQLAKAPLYYYKFSFDGKLNVFKLAEKLNFPGASHVDEIGYLFNVGLFDMDAIVDPPAKLVQNRMVKMWSNFAKTGNPTPDDDPVLPVTWEPYTAANPCYLEINEELSLQQYMFKERMQFWEEFYRNL